GKHALAVGKSDNSGVRHFRAISRTRSFNGYLLANLQDFASPTIPPQDVRAGQLEIPVRHNALFIDNVNVETRVRIRPFEFGYFPFQLYQLIGVILRGERMVRDCRNGYAQKNNRCEQHSDLVFHRPSIILRVITRSVYIVDSSLAILKLSYLNMRSSTKAVNARMAITARM